MSIDFQEPGVDTMVPVGDDYESVIRDAVLEAMRAPMILGGQPELSGPERAELIAQLRELRALLCRLLEMVTPT
jgi:hypothetical protein